MRLPNSSPTFIEGKKPSFSQYIINKLRNGLRRPRKKIPHHVDPALEQIEEILEDSKEG